jgi:sec-independent protein translocase protein TatA
MFNVGPWELVLILLIALIIFGPGKLPEVGQAIGKALREFRQAANQISSSIEQEDSQKGEQPKKTEG